MLPTNQPLPTHDKSDVEMPTERTLVTISNINHSLFAASADNQTSLEMTFSKLGARGVFTYAIQFGLENATEPVTRAELSDYVNSCFAYWNENCGANISQVSQLESTSAEATQAVFT